ALLDDAQKRLSDSFQLLSAEALKSNNEQFLMLAKDKLESFQKEAGQDLDTRRKAIDELVAPIRESLGKVDEKLGAVEKERAGQYAALDRQLRMVTDSQEKLRGETSNLVQALRAPTVRGRWGEIQLRRVVEMAGMLDHCDFQEQTSQTTENGMQRPDLIVNLPGGKCLVVDAKVPLEAYLAATESADEEARQRHLQGHARHVHEHMKRLGEKAYWKQFENAPDMVVMFLPGEVFYSAALEQDPALIERGVQKHVVLASPTTLIALLRAVHYGWTQERLAENARRISEEGRVLYERVATLAGHFDQLGRSLGKSVDHFNRAVGSLDTRVVVSARRLKELGVSSKDSLPEGKPVEKHARALQSPEFASAPTEPSDVQDA
ncbi:MAG: DNA recombination protein RmuC, partial [Myxococcales bacterium]|nr:DNA recombination protein RmuC [Myxococcales bacterium]